MDKPRDLEIQNALQECESLSHLAINRRLELLPKAYLLAKEVNGPQFKDLLCLIAEDVCKGLLSKNIADKQITDAILNIAGEVNYNNPDLIKYSGFFNDVIYYLDYKKVWEK